jgi:thiol:disulfide interchange protein
LGTGNVFGTAWRRKETFFWVAIVGLAVTMQWPMLKGIYYRATGVQGTPSAIKWQTNLDAALAAAREQKRLVLADFGATWCPPCVAMEHETWPNRGVAAQVMGAYVPLKVDVDKDAAAAERFGVSGIPAILLIDADGHIVRRNDGYLPPSGLLDFLAK